MANEFDDPSLYQPAGSTAPKPAKAKKPADDFSDPSLYEAPYDFAAEEAATAQRMAADPRTVGNSPGIQVDGTTGDLYEIMLQQPTPTRGTVEIHDTLGRVLDPVTGKPYAQAQAAPEEGFFDSIGRRLRETFVDGQAPLQRPDDLTLASSLANSGGRGIAAGLSNIGGMATLVGGMPIAKGLDLVAEMGGQQTGFVDDVGRITEQYFQDANDYVANDPRAANPENQVLSAAGQVLPDLAAAFATGGDSAAIKAALQPTIQQTVKQAVLRELEGVVGTGVRMSTVPAVSRGAQLSTDVLEAGGTVGEAAVAGGAGAAGTSLSYLAPEAAVGNVAKRAVLGAGAELSTDQMQNAGENAALPDYLGLDQEYGARDALMAAFLGGGLSAGNGNSEPAPLNDPEAMRQFAPPPEPNLNPNPLSLEIGNILTEVMGRGAPIDTSAQPRVQMEPSAIPLTQETRDVQAKDEERPRQEGGEERQAGTGSGNGQVEAQVAPEAVTTTGATPVVQEAGVSPQAPASPLAPRMPPEEAIPDDFSADDARRDVSAARTPDERSRAAGRLAAVQRRDSGVRPDVLPDGAGDPGASEDGGAGAASRTGDTDLEVRQALGEASKAVTIVQSTRDLPEALRSKIEGDSPNSEANGEIEGFYDPDSGVSYVIEGNLDTKTMTAPERRVWVAAHERAGHAGLRGMFVDEAGGSAIEGTKALVSTLDRAEQNPTVSALATAMRTQRPADARFAVEESIAELAAAVRTGNYGEIEKRYGVKVPEAQRNTVRGYIDRVVQQIKKVLRLGDSVPDVEIYKLIEGAYRYAVENPRARGTSKKATGELVAQRAFHGTPTKGIEKFDLNKVNTGEGNQAYGWGMYFAGRQKVADSYRKGLSAVGKTNGGIVADALLQKNGGDRARTMQDIARLKVADVAAAERMTGLTFGSEGSLQRQLEGAEKFVRADGNRGQLYQQEIPEDSELLDYDAPLSEQPPAVRAALRKLRGGEMFRESMQEFEDSTGNAIYRALMDDFGSDQDASEILREAGIPGLRYRDGMSRRDGSDPTYNYVIWNQDTIGAPEGLIASRTTSGLLRNLTPAEQKKVTEKVAAKVTAIIEKLPPRDEMAAIAYAGRAKRGWYAQSAQAISGIFGHEAPQFAGLLAALSPQISVEGNLKNALNVWKGWVDAGRPTDSDAIREVVQSTLRKTFGTPLDAWMNNSVRALQNQGMLSGPKVDSFMKNLLGDVQEVTNDAWMANWALVSQTLFKGNMLKSGKDAGKGAGYLAMNAVVRDAARRLTNLTGETWTPAEVQETVWSWAKTLTELADSATESRSATELVQDRAVTDELIAATPDFGTLFTSPEYRSILEESGYAEELKRIGTGRSDAGAAIEEEPAAGGKAGPFAAKDQQRFEQRSAKRIDQLLADRRAADQAVEPVDDDYIPFSRKQAKQVYGEDQGRDLKGAPSLVTIPGRGKIQFHGYKPAQDIAQRYAARHDQSLPTTYAKVDEARAKRIAQAYEDMEHAPQDPEVQRAYKAMINETVAQYRDILKTGLKVEFITGDDPYAASPRLAILDVVDNNHLWVFPTDSGFGSSELDVSDNPLLAETEFKVGDKTMLANDVFRVVHDYFGHIANGVGFRADGEENAWREHSAMYSPLARRAMTSETRGQNSWVNYGPAGEANQTASASDTVYADQKTGLLPEWVSEEGRGDEVEGQTKTAAFKRWFGDSKVVDSEGRPLVVYHGTARDFDSFRTDTPGAVGQGAYFSPDPRAASNYAARNGNDGASVVPAYLSLQRPYEVNGTEKVPTRKQLERRGYDGIIYRHGWNDGSVSVEYVAFKPAQIKSATGNSGAFDPDNDSIIASRGFSAKPRQPDAVSVDAYHYSREDGLDELDPTQAGSGAAGRERKRFGTGRFGKRGGTSARMGFYVRERGAPVPAGESQVLTQGRSLYRVQLDNLYDLDADPQGLVTGNVDETEEAISEAGYDGFTTSAQSGLDVPTAVVFDIDGTIPVEQVEDGVLASRGKKKKADPQTETPAFKRWFGDSKVVDAGGEPLVVYHGTNASFDTFSDSVERANDPGALGRGFYFTTSKDDAEVYANGGETISAYLTMKNPLKVKDGVEKLLAKDEFLEEQLGSTTYPAKMAVLLNALGKKHPEVFDKSESSDWALQFFEQSELDGDGDVAADVRLLIEQAGYDGVAYDFGGGVVEYVAFNPNQIKSTTGNSGAFDPDNDSIIASRRTPAQARADRQAKLTALGNLGYTQGTASQPVPGGRFEPIQKAADALRVKLQDKMLPILRAQERTGAANGPAVTSITLDDAMNAYRMENLMHGRAKDQVDRADAELIQPAQRMMKNLGVLPETVMDVMLATHAEERNRKVASINGMADGAAGITTQEARDILAGTAEGPYSGKKLTPEDIRKAKQVWVKFREMRERTIENMVEAGQITKREAATLRASYKDYVPLRGKDDDFAGDFGGHGTGRGLTVPKAPIKRALGRGKGNLPINILGEIVGDLQRSIVAKEKARVVRGFLKFALNNPMPDLFEVEPVDLEWKFSEATGEAYLGVKTAAEDKEVSIIARHDGDPVRIRFHDKQLRDAMMNMGVDDLGTFVKLVGALNRWRSKVLTQYNPAFTPINVLRDLQFGMVALAAEKGVGAAARAAWDYLPAMRAMWLDAGDTKPGNPNVPNAQKRYVDWAREAAEAGMKTGLTQVDDVTDLQRRMSVASTSLMNLAAQGRVFRLTGESIVRTMKPITDTISRVNDATENALRLATYIAERKKGSSPAKAAEYAKNLTINFNRKGQLGPALNAVYLFYNASIQGTHAVQRLLRNPKVLAYLAALMAMQAALSDQMMEDEEGDGVTVWDEIPDYVKRTSFVIPLGAITGNKRDYFALPMPYGFNLFTYSGGRAMQAYRYGKRDTDPSFLADVLKSTTEAFSPVPVAEGYGSLFGDQIGFAMNLAANKDDFGSPLVNVDQYEQYDVPRALLGKVDTPRPYHVTAQLLAKIGGGDLSQRKPPIGYLDIAPEQIESVVNYLGGGLAALTNKSIRWYEQLDANNLDSAMDVIAATPIASRMVGSAKQDRAISERYYGERGELARKKDVLDDVLSKKTDDKDAIIDKMAESDPVYRDLDVDRYKSKGKSGQKKGDIKRTQGGNVQLKEGADSVYTTLKSSEKVNKAISRGVRAIRAEDVTNEEVVTIVRAYGPDETDTSYTLVDIDLPETYKKDAVAPTRVRTRAIKLLQQARMVNQRKLLRKLGGMREDFRSENMTPEEREADWQKKIDRRMK